ncbi:MAG: C10 family peptidase [Bacteroidales bacterium]|nr:C10 family peptidase [Bacteroidales bacterium]
MNNTRLVSKNEIRNNKWCVSILSVLFLLPVSQLWAQQRSPGSVQSIAQSFGRETTTLSALSTSQSVVIEKSSDILNEPTMKSLGLEAFYVITPPSGKGFIIVSGDVRMRKILGFSNTDIFKKDSLPDNVYGWFQQYAEEMMSLPAVAGPPVDDIFGEETDPTEPRMTSLPIREGGVSPLLGSIQWDQTSPFNNMCPIDNDGNRSVTGCVATAMAQVMKYHQYPSSGSGSISYTTSTNGLNVSTTLGATYHWSQMLDSYSNGFTTTQENEVAQLMFHCGASVEMDYTSNASGAYQGDIRNSLFKYFGYDQDMAYVTKDNYTDESWHTLLLKEINANRPVNYSGRSGLSGHSFVLDGYRQTDGVEVPYYHVNWGWRGFCDGYYLLSSLTPSSPGTGGGNGDYSYGQTMVIGIMAEDGIYGTPVLDGSFTPSETIFRYGEANNMTFSLLVTNCACRTFNGNLNLVAISSSGYETELKTIQVNNDLPSDYYTSFYSQTISIPSSLSADTYKLEWRAYYSGKNKFSTVNFPSNYELIIYDESPQLIASAQCSSLQIKPTEEYCITLKVKNTGNSKYMGTITAHLHQETCDTDLTSDYCSIAPNTTSDVVISGLLRTMAPGEVTITFANDIDHSSIKNYAGQTLTINTTAEAATADVAVYLMKANTTTSSRVFTIYSYNFLNNSAVNFIGDVQLALIDDDDNILCHLGDIWSNSDEGLQKGHYYTYARVFSDQFPNTIPNGTYRLVTIARQANSGIWSIATKWYSTELQYLNVEVSSYSVLIDNVEFEKDPFAGEVLVSNITLDRTEVTMKPGEILTLTATISPSIATNQNLSWSSSNSRIASVDANGTVTAKAKGTTVITCKANDGSGVKATCTITVDEVVYGDVNSDADIDVSDVALTVEYILGHNPNPFNFAAADMNNDAVIDIVDVTRIVNVILYGSATVKNAPLRDAEGEEQSAFYIQKINNEEFALCLNGNNSITGFQFDLHLPSSVQLIGMGKSDSMSALTLATSEMEDGSIRTICFSLSNEVVSSGGDPIIIFRIKTESLNENEVVSFENIIASTSTGERLLFSNITLPLFSEVPTSIMQLDEAKASESIYSISGLKCKFVPKGIVILRTSEGTIQKIYIK